MTLNKGSCLFTFIHAKINTHVIKYGKQIAPCCSRILLLPYLLILDTQIIQFCRCTLRAKF